MLLISPCKVEKFSKALYNEGTLNLYFVQSYLNNFSICKIEHYIADFEISAYKFQYKSFSLPFKICPQISSCCTLATAPSAVFVLTLFRQKYKKAYFNFLRLFINFIFLPL